MENINESLKKMTGEFFMKSSHKISLEKFWETDNILFLDIREKSEVATIKFDLTVFGKETINIPVSELPEKYQTLPKDKLIVPFCTGKTRAGFAYLFLFDKGYNSKILIATIGELASSITLGKITKAQK